ncbi:MAG: pYEATS domain-containing protein [Bacteroidota bacterium]
MEPTKYSVKQSSKPDTASENYWDWSVWIDASHEDLNKINSVVYILHPTFKNRVRTIASRNTKFKLRSKGWGEFRIYIRIYFNEEGLEPLYLTHDLKLFQDYSSSKSKVFISSQFMDKEKAKDLKDELTKENFDVLAVDDLNTGSNIFESIENRIAESDIMIVLGDTFTRYQMHELNSALEKDKEVFIISEETNDDYKNIKHVDSIEQMVKTLKSKKE